jgi:toxin ParE1/3/4
VSLPVVLSRDAERDFDSAADWYQHKAGLGARFTKHLRDVFDRIARMPELHAIVHRDVRCARVRRFPYNIFYRVRGERIEVIAILHGHRDPTI